MKYFYEVKEEDTGIVFASWKRMHEAKKSLSKWEGIRKSKFVIEKRCKGTGELINRWD